MDPPQILAGAIQDDVGHALADHIVIWWHRTTAALAFEPAFVAYDFRYVGYFALDEFGFAAHRGSRKAHLGLGEVRELKKGVGSIVGTGWEVKEHIA
jgi:hypothetical protein